MIVSPRLLIFALVPLLADCRPPSPSTGAIAVSTGDHAPHQANSVPGRAVTTDNTYPRYLYREDPGIESSIAADNLSGGQLRKRVTAMDDHPITGGDPAPTEGLNGAGPSDGSGNEYEYPRGTSLGAPDPQPTSSIPIGDGTNFGPIEDDVCEEWEDDVGGAGGDGASGAPATPTPTPDPNPGSDSPVGGTCTQHGQYRCAASALEVCHHTRYDQMGEMIRWAG